MQDPVHPQQAPRCGACFFAAGACVFAKKNHPYYMNTFPAGEKNTVFGTAIFPSVVALSAGSGEIRMKRRLDDRASRLCKTGVNALKRNARE